MNHTRQLVACLLALTVSVPCLPIPSQVPVITGSVKSYNYCSLDIEIYILTVNLELEYTNENSTTVVIPKPPPSIWGNRTSRSLEDMDAGRFDSEMSSTPVRLKELPPLLEEPDDRFVILKPHEAKQFTTTTFLAVAKVGKEFVPNTATMHSQYLQIFYFGWPYPEEWAKEAKKKWKDYGVLIHEATLVSEPIPIEITQTPKLTHCP